MKKVWCIDPQSGGTKIPDSSQEIIVRQVDNYSSKQKWYPKFKLIIRFRNQFCYLDASEDGGEPFPIGRLRYFQSNRWSLAFFTYSNERYEPCFMKNGEYGTLEEAIDVCSTYLV
jgi:hypothetical protein